MKIKKTLIIAFIALVTNFVNAQIDPIVWSLLKDKKSPIELNLYYPDNMEKAPYIKNNSAIEDTAWTFPLIVAAKLTAIKQEMQIYSEYYQGKSKIDFAKAQSVFSGYVFCNGGNFVSWIDNSPMYEVQKTKVISKLKNKKLKNEIWQFVQPALRHQVSTMDLKYQGILVSTFEYVSNYFGTTYDLKKAENWYKQDDTNQAFACNDYMGNEHPARKVTAFIERLVFKHQIMSLEEIRKWIEIIGDWLKQILGSEYNVSKQYWYYFDSNEKNHFSSKYEAVFHFNNGFAIVTKNNKWGFIDTAGKEICSIQYNNVYDFIDGFARVKIGDKYGIIDESGKEICQVQYDYIFNFIDGFAHVKIGDKYGVIDKTGKEICPIKYDWVSNFENGVVLVQIGKFYGLINKVGVEFLPVQNDIISILNDGKYKVEKGGLWGLIDANGKWLLPIEYKSIDNCMDGLVKINKGLFWGFINNYGEEIVPLKYNYISSFVNGLAIVNIGGKVTDDVCEGGKWWFIDKAGKEISKIQYDEIYVNRFYNFNDDGFIVDEKYQFFVEGHALVKLNEKWGFVDTTCKEICLVKYDEVINFSNGFAEVNLNGKWGFINNQGKEICAIKYDEVEPFSNGLSKVKIGDKCGFIDVRGREVIPVKYNLINSFENGFAAVNVGGKDFAEFVEGGKWGIIDDKGREVIPIIYDSIIHCFIEGKAKVERYGKVYYINTKGVCVEWCD